VDEPADAPAPPEVTEPDAGVGAPQPGPDPAAGARRRRTRAWVIATIVVVVAAAVVSASFLIRLEYYTEAPGDAVDVQPLIAIDGAPSYPDTPGRVMLLYVRRRERITLFRYVQAWLDPDIDAKKTDYDEPFQSPADRDAVSASDMAIAQLAARKLALEHIGEKVTTLPGLVVASVIAGRPAAEVLRAGDVLVAVDGTTLGDERPGEQLAAAITAHEPGETVEVTYERDGEEHAASIATVDPGTGDAIIGVITEPRYDFPVDIRFEGQIESIGGPSAGLAMTLAAIDELTPGDLFGGARVAVTGTIGLDGDVGEVGRVDLKSKAARRRGATLMLVPDCTEPSDRDAYRDQTTYDQAVDFFTSCEDEVREARSVIDTVVEVDNLDEALAALAANGGDALPASSTTTTASTSTTTAG
jgi:PDZ domain-containing protein